MHCFVTFLVGVGIAHMVRGQFYPSRGLDRRQETEENIQNYIDYLNDFEVFYVDVDSGDDIFNGQSPWRHGTSETGPFKTIRGALRRIRRLRQSPSLPVKLYIRSGFHKINHQIRLTEQDSNLELLAYPFDNERPVISGAKRIWGRNFQPVHKLISGKWIYQHPYDGVCSAHVFINGKRMIRARKPNLYEWTGRNLAGEGPYLLIRDLLLPTDECQRSNNVYNQKCLPRNKAGFRFTEGDFARNATNVNDIQVLVFHAWTAERRFVQKLTKDNRVIFDSNLREPVGTRPQPSGWRYIIENSFEDLDAVGEFYCDSKKNMLYVIPPDEAFMNGYVFIGQNSALLKGLGVQDLSITGLEFKYTHDDFVGWFNSRPSLLEFENSTGIHVRNNIFAHVGHNAVVVSESRHISVLGNHFYDIGNFAINVANPPLGKARMTTSQYIEIGNNTFRGCGVYHMLQPSCIHVRGIRGIRVIGNDICQSPYAGIKVGWQKSFSPTHATSAEPVFYIAENHVYDYGLAILSDFAGVYLSTNMRDCGLYQIAHRCHLHAVVTRNVIHGGRSYAYGAAAIYSDTAASSVTVSENWLYDVGGPAINFHCGLNNTALNNMIVHVNPNRIFGTCNHATANGDRPRQFFAMLKNVVYVENPHAVMYRRGDWWDFDKPYLNLNVYFGGLTRSEIFFPKNISIDEWRRDIRNDMDSLITNPRFASIEERILTLQPQSPARELGIKSVDLMQVLRKDSNIWMFLH